MQYKTIYVPCQVYNVANVVSAEIEKQGRDGFEVVSASLDSRQYDIFGVLMIFKKGS